MFVWERHLHFKLQITPDAALSESNWVKSYDAHSEFRPMVVGEMIFWKEWPTPERMPCCDQYETQDDSSCQDPTDTTSNMYYSCISWAPTLQDKVFISDRPQMFPFTLRRGDRAEQRWRMNGKGEKETFESVISRRHRVFHFIHCFLNWFDLSTLELCFIHSATLNYCKWARNDWFFIRWQWTIRKTNIMIKINQDLIHGVNLLLTTAIM